LYFGFKAGRFSNEGCVFEKEHFPREKIRGDALSGKVLNTLKRLPGHAYDKFVQ